jgi:hypothetical protein
MLVKQADLPKITLEHDVKNQYNRKKIIYKELKYEPLNLTFHDDSLGVVNALWAQYLSYYSPERFQPQEAWHSTSTGPYGLNGVKGQSLWRYGLDVSRGVKEQASTAESDPKFKDSSAHSFTQPFFKDITLYTLSRKRFNAYTLVNPHIVSWSHGNVDQSSNNGTVEAQMSLAYESILYGTGIIVSGKEPDGFANLYYDTTPSPLTIGGGTISGISGLASGLTQALIGDANQGVVNDAQAIYGANNVQLGIFGSKGSFLQNTAAAINFYKSIRSLNKESLVAEATNLLLSPNASTNIVSGLRGISVGTRDGR